MSRRDPFFTDEITIRLSRPDDRGSRCVRAWRGDVLVLDGILEPRRVRVVPACVHSYIGPAGQVQAEAAILDIEALINDLAVGS